MQGASSLQRVGPHVADFEEHLGSGNRSLAVPAAPMLWAKVSAQLDVQTYRRGGGLGGLQTILMLLLPKQLNGRY